MRFAWRSRSSDSCPFYCCCTFKVALLSGPTRAQVRCTAIIRHSRFAKLPRWLSLLRMKMSYSPLIKCILGLLCLVSASASAVDRGTITTTNCVSAASYSQTTVIGNVGDTFTLQNLMLAQCNGFTSTNTAVFGPSPANLPANGGSATFTLSGVGTARLFFFFFSPVTVIVNAAPAPAPAPSAVPTLSEWSQMLLALMVLAMIGWQWRKQ